MPHHPDCHCATCRRVQRLVGGVEVEVRSAALGLARVSVVRGEGPRKFLPCIDDHLRTVEPVYDHLTKFSGVQPGVCVVGP